MTAWAREVCVWTGLAKTVAWKPSSVRRTSSCCVNDTMAGVVDSRATLSVAQATLRQANACAPRSERGIVERESESNTRVIGWLGLPLLLVWPDPTLWPSHGSTAPNAHPATVAGDEHEFSTGPRADGRDRARHARGAGARGAREEAPARQALADQSRLRSHGAGSAPGPYGAAQQNARLPAVRARGHFPDRRFHRSDRRSDRTQCHAPAPDSRGDPGQRGDLPAAGVQDPRSGAYPRGFQFALALGPQRGRVREARGQIDRGTHAGAR